ncbi:MAG: TIGR03905 family TSCPD domain-containing protein [Clostridia bacterium]|nr:TIGR03905 family TSCPD domain-containing protein [Clostridia bacterium]
MHYTYKTSGTCSASINFDVEDGVVRNVGFVGGCNGNLKGIGKLVEGMKLEDVVDKLKNTTCGSRSTSCPDQLARACESVLEGKI